jgi:hypothetical protein
MTPQELEQHLIAQLNALPTEENRLLYDIDYDEGLVIETARNLLAHNPFPLSPRLNAHRLTILAAFASAMADDEYAELDSFYNRLSDIFFANVPLDVNRQNEIRDFVEETCNQYGLRFLRNQNRLVRNTIWLHGGLPSRHWKSFFEHVLMRAEESLENLDGLLNPPTPRTIKRFYELCGNSARTFLRDCIEMREALLQPDANTYSAEDFGVSHLFFNAFQQHLQNNPPQAQKQRSTLFFDERRLRVIELPQGNEINPTQNWYAFRTNGKYLSRCKSELPKTTVVFICRSEFRINEEVPRPIETEHLFGNWNGYRCEWLNLENQQALTLAHGNSEFRIDVISTPSVSLVGEKLTLNNRAVLVQHQGSELEVFTTLPELVIENVSEHYLEKLRLYVNGEQKNINLAQHTSLAQLNLPEGIYTLQLRGARGLDPIQFAYLPNLGIRLDKNEYRANESLTLFINGEKPCLLPHNTPRATTQYKSYTLSIPVPLFGWQITGDEFSSEPISIATNKLPIRQGEKHLTVYFGNRHETCATLHLKRGNEILQSKMLSVTDGYLKLDLASYRDIANANPELDFIFTVGNDVIPVLRTFKEWEPKITHRIEGKTVTLTIQDNAEGFRNRELILWNLCRLWEKPTIVPIPDGENEIIHTFEHEGEYGIQARIKPSGWGRAKELTPFDVPTSFNAQFRIENITFRDFLRQRQEELRRILLNNEDIPVREREFIAILTYLLKTKGQEETKKWIHLFLALPEAIHNCFQAALYSETHPAVEAVRDVYEKMIESVLNGRQAYVTQFACVDVIEVKFSAERYQQDEHDGFMLRWNTNADRIRIIGIPNANNLQPEGQWFDTTDALKFDTLVARRGNARRGNSTAIATVAIAREPLIVCFQAVQLDNTRFRLVWNVLKADEVELSTQGRNERVQPNGMKEVQPEHGQEFTLTAIAQGKDVPHKTIKTEFARPYIQKFEATEIEDDTVTLCWETLRADSVRIEPNIGEVAHSGEMKITKQQLAAGIRLLATNKGGTEEKELAIDFDEMPFWFQEGVVVKIEHNEWTFYAKVSNLLFGLFGRTGQLTFAKMRAVDFTILYSKANRVYVRLSGDAVPASVLELSSCRMPEPLSDLDNLINSLR